MVRNELLWVEKYRPKTINECILPESYKKIFQEYVDRKEIPHLLLSGSPGVGKTTVAFALCREVGCDYLFLNGSDENGIDVFRTKIKNYASSISLDGSKKVIIIDEADYMNPSSLQPALRGAMEEFAHNCSFIMTCNYKNKIIEPLHSRCAVIDFKIDKADKNYMLAHYLKRSIEIFKKEKIEYHKPEIVIEVIKKYFPDFRKTLNEFQRYSMIGQIDIGMLKNGDNEEFDDLINSLQTKNFTKMRKWVGEHGVDPTTLFRKIYDSLYDFMKKESIPSAVVILAKYQYQAGFVADQELNMVACLTEIMCDCEFNG